MNSFNDFNDYSSLPGWDEESIRLSIINSLIIQLNSVYSSFDIIEHYRKIGVSEDILEAEKQKLILIKEELEKDNPFLSLKEELNLVLMPD